MVVVEVRRGTEDDKAVLGEDPNHVRVDCLALGRECVKRLGRLGFAQRIEQEAWRGVG